jgi:Flavin containing amine oxidoreductase
MASVGNTRRADPRICIVGAGASGLAAAYALEQRGYRHITMLERERRVGGKCRTIEHEGRAYELGAAALTFAYRNVRTLLAEAGLRTSLALTQAFIDVEQGRTSNLPLALARARDFGSLGTQGARFARELWRHRRIRTPGFEGVSEELAMPFETWCRTRHVELIGELMKPWSTAFGYGFFGEVPAAYMLKYATLFGTPLFDVLEHGFGGLWQRVAAALRGTEVRLGVSIERVARADEGVHVETTEDSFDFDALVIACPLDEALKFLDATPEEASLFSRIRYYDYWVVGLPTEGLPRVRCLFLPRNFAPEHAGRPMFVYQRWPGEGLAMFYGFAPGGAGEWQAAAGEAAGALAERIGGRVRGAPVTTALWHYFPHVGTEDMAAGFYPRMEGLQGKRATYYCGEVLSFATVENTVGYARAMVERHFARRA